MSMLLAKRCCCGGCWYRVPPCDCEDDDEPCRLYIDCALLEEFFDLFPELEGCLTFELFDGENDLCYRACEDEKFKVTVLPPEACELEEIPPSNTWRDTCNTCCGECCPPCHTGAGGEPTCCYKVGDTGVATLTSGGFSAHSYCCIDGVTSSFSCPTFTYSASYELCECGGVVMFCRSGGNPCMPPWLLYNCNDFGGWDRGPSFCYAVDPCTLPQPCPGGCNCNFPSTWCGACAAAGGECCSGGSPGPGPQPGPEDDPCAGIPMPDECFTNCRRECSVSLFPFLKSVNILCNPDGSPPPVSPNCRPNVECGCQIQVFTFTTTQGCHPENEPAKCLP
jgi:hypothetical protein